MERAASDFGKALSVDAEAIGRPGQRRFRLIVRGEYLAASIWMEKEQLAGIGEWLDQMIERLDREQPPEPDVDPLAVPETFDVEFRASQIGLGYVAEDGLFAVHVFDEDGPGGTPAFRCLLSRGQGRVLVRKIASVVAAGRPTCPLCDLPIDPDGHVCPRSNGHQPVRT